VSTPSLFHFNGTKLPQEVQLMIVRAAVDFAPATVLPTTKLPSIAHVSRGLQQIWISLMQQRRSSFVFPFPNIPIPEPDFTEMGPPPPGWQWPMAHFTGELATQAAAMSIEWEIAVWFQNTFKLDVFEAIRTAQDLVPRAQRNEDEGDVVGAMNLGWERNESEFLMRGRDINLVFAEDRPFQLFEWPEGYTEVRVNEHGELLLRPDGKPDVGPSPQRFGGDAWEGLRDRPAVNGTRGIIFPPQWTPPPLLYDVPQPSVIEALVFPSLLSMASYFGSRGPGALEASNWMLTGITHLYIKWCDDHTTRTDGGSGRHGASRYAYEAFKALVASRDRMPNLRVLQIHATASLGFTVDSPGMWWVLQLRDIQTVELKDRGWVDLELCRVIRQRLSWAAEDRTKPSNGWTPTGLERPAAVAWLRDIVSQSPAQQFRWLERYYHDHHDRVTVEARREMKQQKKRKRRGVISDDSES
jgi:hypothetical protein